MMKQVLLSSCLMMAVNAQVPSYCTTKAPTNTMMPTITPTHAPGWVKQTGPARRNLLAQTTVFTDIDTKSIVDMTTNVNLVDGVSTLIACHTVVINGHGFGVNAQKKCRPFHISQGIVDFNDITIQNGKADYGGGILIDGTSVVTFNGAVLFSNEATISGGAIYFESGSLTLNMYDSFVRANTASGGNGGGIHATGTTVIDMARTSFARNTCTGDGGGLYVAGDFDKTIDNLSCIYKDNIAGGYGGGYYHGGGGSTTAYDDSNYVVGNTAQNSEGKGGGYYQGGNGNSHVTHERMTISHNTAGDIFDEKAEQFFDKIYGAVAGDCQETKTNNGVNGFVRVVGSQSNGCKASDWYGMGSRTCFSSEDTVQLEGTAAQKYVRELEVGDRILSANRNGDLSYSTVVFVPHGNGIKNNKNTVFVELTTETDKKIKMSTKHLIPNCKGDLMLAQDMKEGSCVRTVDGDEIISSVDMVELNGVYTAITENEFLVVNGIIASPFASTDGTKHAMYNQTDVDAWCSSNNWLVYEHEHKKVHQENTDQSRKPSKYCEEMLENLYANYKDEPIGWGNNGWGYAGWKNPSSRPQPIKN